VGNRARVLAAAAIAIGVVASQATATTIATADTNLQSLVPVPANTQRTDGPDSIHDNGIHLHFLVNGSPTDVMNAYQPALQGKGWVVTVQNSGGSGGGGGATYTATNGNTYGVFTGGGYGSTTDLEACAWPAKPSNTDCGSGNR
jgi:hypothetical protein